MSKSKPLHREVISAAAARVKDTKQDLPGVLFMMSMREVDLPQPGGPNITVVSIFIPYIKGGQVGPHIKLEFLPVFSVHAIKAAVSSGTTGHDQIVYGFGLLVGGFIHEAQIANHHRVEFLAILVLGQHPG